MALFLDGSRYALFSSPDLKDWTKLGDVPEFGASECPDFFELPVDGRARHPLGLLGRQRQLSPGPLRRQDLHQGERAHRPTTAATTTRPRPTATSPPPTAGGSRSPGWPAGTYPGMPFNQQMSLPAYSRCGTSADGIRMCRQPVRESRAPRQAAPTERPGADRRREPSGGHLRRAVRHPRRDRAWHGGRSGPDDSRHAAPLRRQGQRTGFDGQDAPLEPVDGKIRLQVLVDRSSIEAFGNDGRVSLRNCFLPPVGDKSLALGVQGGG